MAKKPPKFPLDVSEEVQKRFKGGTIFQKRVKNVKGVHSEGKEQKGERLKENFGVKRGPWNRGKSVGQKKPFTPKQVRTIKTLLEEEENWRDLALFSVGVDTMLRSSDLLNLTVEEVTNHQGKVLKEFHLRQQKTKAGNLVSISPETQKNLLKWIQVSKKYADDFLFTGITKHTLHKKLSHVQHTRLVKKWAESIKLNPVEYSTHSVRRTKAAYLYQMTGNIEAVRLLLGQKSVSATSAYLNIDKRQALNIAESFEL